jgi:hypothetical protein
MVRAAALLLILDQDYALHGRALAGDDVCAPTAAARRRFCTEGSHPPRVWRESAPAWA